MLRRFLLLLACATICVPAAPAQFAPGACFTGISDGSGNPGTALILVFGPEGGPPTDVFDIGVQIPGLGLVESGPDPLDVTPWGTLLCDTGYMPGAKWFEVNSSGVVVAEYPDPFGSDYYSSYGPNGATVGPDGFIYAVHHQPYSGSMVVVFDPTSANPGTPVLTWNAGIECLQPAIVGDHVFVSGWSNAPLREFDLQGQFVADHGPFGSVHATRTTSNCGLVLASNDSPYGGTDAWLFYDPRTGASFQFSTPWSGRFGTAADRSGHVFLARSVLAGAEVEVCSVEDGMLLRQLPLTWSAAGSAIGFAVNAGPRLAPPSPGMAGAANVLELTGAQVGSIVWFVYAMSPGCTPVPWAAGLSVQLRNPAMAGTATANLGGVASLTVNVPPGAAGRVVWFQGLDLWANSLSNVVMSAFS